MNARKFLNVRVVLTMTALALSGAMVLAAASCAGGGSGGGGSAGNSNGGSSGSNGGSSGSNGGSSGSNGGSSGGGSCSAGSDGVCFSTGKASGVMTGYGWIALGSLDSASSPVCAPDATDTTKTQPITKDKACPSTGSTVWGSTDGLCISGDIPALPASPVQSDYDNNWGLQIGVNASDTEGKEIGTAYSSIALTFNGTPTTGLRAELHVKGDPAGTTYCYDGISSGKALKLTDFNTMCWSGVSCTDPACKQFSSDSAKNIDKVGMQVSSTAAEIKVSNLCLTGLQFKS